MQHFVIKTSVGRVAILQKMFVLGLTGPSGAGKSLAAQHLEERGFRHYDADKAARAVVEPGKPCLAALAEAFGPLILRADGSLDRKKLAELSFAGGRVAQLNAITHPFIYREIERELTDMENSGAQFATLDAPTLYECGVDRFCNRVLAVTAGRELRIKRIMARDGITTKQAEARVDAQPDVAFYKEKADFLACSDGGETELFGAIDSIADKIINTYCNYSYLANKE